MLLYVVLAAAILVAYLIIKGLSNQIQIQERLQKERLDRLNERVTSFMDTFKNSVQLSPPIMSDGGDGREQRGLRDQEIAESILEALTSTPPPLERVYDFSMWMTREFTRDTVGITDEELSELDERIHLAPLRFWPASDITIQEWSTHLVVYRNQQYGLTVYEPDRNPFRYPVQLWSHTFGSKVKGPNEGGSLEVVLHEHALKCWARNGRFKSNWSYYEARDECIFIKIPLQARELEKYLRAELESDDPELRYKHTPAYREYYHEDPSGFGWHLNVRDMVAYKAEGKRYRWS